MIKKIYKHNKTGLFYIRDNFQYYSANKIREFTSITDLIEHVQLGHIQQLKYTGQPFDAVSYNFICEFENEKDLFVQFPEYFV